MTTLKRKLQREAAARSLPRPLIIELEPPNLITLREKGRKKRFTTSTEALMLWLIEQEREQARKAKKRKRGRR